MTEEVCINCNQYVEEHSDKECKECLVEYAGKLGLWRVKKNE